MKVKKTKWVAQLNNGLFLCKDFDGIYPETTKKLYEAALFNSKQEALEDLTWYHLRKLGLGICLTGKAKKVDLTYTLK